MSTGVTTILMTPLMHVRPVLLMLVLILTLLVVILLFAS
jgi:hypothetical protein